MELKKLIYEVEDIFTKLTESNSLLMALEIGIFSGEQELEIFEAGFYKIRKDFQDIEKELSNSINKLLEKTKTEVIN